MKIWILFISFSISFTQEKKGELIEGDRAVFRMEEKVFMLSDLNGYLKQIKVFRCFSRKSYLLGALQLERSHLKSIPSSGQLNKNLQKHEMFLFSLLKMIKLESFANKQKIDASSSFFSKLGIRNCVKKNWKKWPDRLRSLVHTELFLRDRYGRGEKAKEQMELFIQTIDRKFSHNLFF
ncbi:MAG: hypothetical protein OXB84_00245 [Halobacteriovoraceae bacterium]|nr:hypothetical protein [Halobacteriovoraceae bacterium]